MQTWSSQEAMATHASVCGTLTASILSASSLCSTRLVRSLGNLHVVAGERDPVFCEQWGSHRHRQCYNQHWHSQQLKHGAPAGKLPSDWLWATWRLHSHRAWSVFCQLVSSALRVKLECVFFLQHRQPWDERIWARLIRSCRNPHFSLLLTMVSSPLWYFGWGAPATMGWTFSYR